MKTRVLALTGIRSEYDLLYPLLKELENSDDFELGVLISGAHLTPLHNYSYKQIENDGFNVVSKIDNLLYSNSSKAKAKSLGILLQSLSDVFEQFQPDFIIVLGDREEPLIAATAATYMNIPIIHIAGGDHTVPELGDVDEQVRHATSKLSHVHFVMHEEHKKRLIALGEEEWRIFVTGNSGVDRIKMVPVVERDMLAHQLDSLNILEKYAVLIYHPLSSEIDTAHINFKLIIDTLLAEGIKIFIGSPNSDPGFENLLKIIESYKVNEDIFVYSNLDRITFINLLRYANLLIGNSSLGILEAPYLKLPVVNVGERQKGRISGANVSFVGTTSKEIVEGIRTAMDKLEDDLVKDMYLYGDGDMAKKAINYMRNLPIKEKLLAKKNTY